MFANREKALWLNFWSSANESGVHPDTGKWVGVYVVFGVLTLVFMGFEVG